MATKCTLILLEENTDGVRVRMAHWATLDDNAPTPPTPPGLFHAIFNGPIQPTETAKRNAGTRSALKTLFGQFVDTRYTNTPA